MKACQSNDRFNDKTKWINEQTKEGKKKQSKKQVKIMLNMAFKFHWHQKKKFTSSVIQLNSI